MLLSRVKYSNHLIVRMDSFFDGGSILQISGRALPRPMQAIIPAVPWRLHLASQVADGLNATTLIVMINCSRNLTRRRETDAW